MPNTYTQLTVQVVFAVKGRAGLIQAIWRDELHRYIAGIINSETKSLAVGGWKDHVHILFELPATISVSSFVQKVKANSSRWINERKFIKGKFSWQEGYGAFSYSRERRDQIINYIMNQEKHHEGKSFKKEYLELLKEYDVKYEDKYLFEFYDNFQPH